MNESTAYRKGYAASLRSQTADLDAAEERFSRSVDIAPDGLDRLCDAFTRGWTDAAADIPREGTKERVEWEREADKEEEEAEMATLAPIHYQTDSSHVACGARMRKVGKDGGWDLGTVSVAWHDVTCPVCLTHRYSDDVPVNPNRFDHDRPDSTNPSEWEYEEVMADGATVLISKVGGGTIGKAYDGAWHWSWTLRDQHREGSDFETPITISHSRAAEMVVTCGNTLDTLAEPMDTEAAWAAVERVREMTEEAKSFLRSIGH